MRRWMLPLFAAVLLLGGCATTIQNEVTAFNDWPQDLPDKSFAFAPGAAQDNDLEYRRYQELVRAQLLRLGFTDAAGKAPRLKVALDYGIDSRDVRTIEPVVIDPYWFGPPPFYGPYWRRFGYYGPFYDPFWYQPVVQQRETSYRVYTRRLDITITRAADGRQLYQVRVRSEGRIGSLPAVMPAMIRAAFADFPGPNGVPRQIELKLDPVDADK
ncbi:MAG: DUF4136 domain-containing protein [Burkholderiaceae bacterium]